VQGGADRADAERHQDNETDRDPGTEVTMTPGRRSDLNRRRCGLLGGDVFRGEVFRGSGRYARLRLGHEGLGHEGLGHEGLGHEGLGRGGLVREGVGRKRLVSRSARARRLLIACPVPRSVA
jgi:hypothetical protein